jgi:hypothetical protein
VPPRAPADPSRAPQPRVCGRRWPPIWSATFFALLVLGVGIRAYRDLSRPETWTYWKESYLSPSMTSSVVAGINLGGESRKRAGVAIQGTIGAASAGWLRARLDEAGLAAGDIVLLSSPGGNLEQALIMGEIIRARGLATAVGTADAAGKVEHSYCASACVLVYAGGAPRYGIEGSALGVHRFVNRAPGRDPVADTQRTAGAVLNYMTKMGVSPSVIEAMSATRDVRWLEPAEAVQMHLITDPIDGSRAAR